MLMHGIVSELSLWGTSGMNLETDMRDMMVGQHAAVGAIARPGRRGFPARR